MAPSGAKGVSRTTCSGNAFVMTAADLWASIAVGAIALLLVAVFWKESTLRTFDPAHSTVLGFSARIVTL